MEKYIVYRRTSPSGNSYIGYTKYSLMDRWTHTVNELKSKNTPLANVIKKYGAENWVHEILFETCDETEAQSREIEYIAEMGYYNIAKGGSGGNTGKNNEPEKKAKQARSLKKHWQSLDQTEKNRRIEASLLTRKKNGTLGNCNPRSKENHGNWNGYWYINHVPYTTSKEAAEKTGLNESTIIDLCVKKANTRWTKDTKVMKKGKTPRECGHYKGFKNE